LAVEDLMGDELAGEELTGEESEVTSFLFANLVALGETIPRFFTVWERIL
jgi:hypothetical protein